MKCVVIGAGIAGLVTALELQRRNCDVHLIEAGPFAGGRTSSWLTDSGLVSGTGLHVVANHYVNLLDLLRSIDGTRELVSWREFQYLRPGAPATVWRYNNLPSPFHLFHAARSMPISWSARLQLLRTGQNIARYRQADLVALDNVTYRDWHESQGLGAGFLADLAELAADAATFLPLERVSARAVLSWIKYMSESKESAAISTWRVPLSKGLVDPLVRAFKHLGGNLYLSTAAVRLRHDGLRVLGVVTRSCTARRPAYHSDGHVEVSDNEKEIHCDAVVSALPVQALARLLDAELAGRAGLASTLKLETVPAISVVIAFDRKIRSLPKGPTLMSGCSIRDFIDLSSLHDEMECTSILQLLVSHSEEWIKRSDDQIVSALVGDLGRVCCESRGAQPVQAAVERIGAAMFAATPGSHRLRPTTETSIPNLFVAGDWIQHNVNASMEGAAISGRLAARAVLRDSGRDVPILEAPEPMAARLFRSLTKSPHPFSNVVP
jgi:uncharacterized protein with NAD-binding domain and iron-sulfur cluster